MKLEPNDADRWSAVVTAAEELRRTCRAVGFYGGMARALVCLRLAEQEVFRLKLEPAAKGQERLEL